MKKLIVTWVLSFSLPLFAKYPATVLISDVDDTLKITNVNGTLSGIPSAWNIDRRFTGMQEIYRELEKNNLFFHFYYVSSAPLLLMQQQHEKFLNQHDFPQGQLILRLSGSTLQFKVTKITEIIKRHQAENVILIGDNGQEDAQVFEEIHRQFPQVHFQNFVHLVRDPQSHGVKPFQVGYAYAAELAYHLAQAKYLPIDRAEILMELINNRLLREGNSAEKSFPDWLDCRSHQFTFTGSLQLDLTAQNVSRFCH